MSRFAVITSVVLYISSMPPALGSEGKLNLLCSPQIEWCKLMVATFEHETGVDVSVVRKSSGEALAQIRTESSNPTVDVWWGGTGDPHLQAAAEDLTAPYMPSAFDDLLGWATNMSRFSDGRSVGIYAGAIGIGYNEDLLKSKGLKAPRCWSDLADPSYVGEIQIADPNFSGTAYTALATIVQVFGEDEAFKLLRAIGKNVTHYSSSGREPIRAAARGETTIAITFQHDMVAEAVAGFPIKVVSPCEGTGYEVGAVSLIKGARNLDNAKKWVEFSLRPDIQSLAGSAKAFQVPSHSKSLVPKEAPDLASIKLIDYDFKTFGSPNMRNRLLSRWSSEVKG
jgi:iron(III) transport system substrate-binding protein